MIKRIQKIKNIGKFSDCNPPGCEFQKETIIFGLNTKGKSTLTAIFRSIQTGNNDLVIGRKTFGSVGDKYIEIDFDKNNSKESYIFQNRSWSKSDPDIIIFDSKFITENVFDGESVSFDQQKNLNTIIIGKKGQDLNKEIIALQTIGDKCADDKRSKTKEFSKHFQNENLSNFKDLPKKVNIDQEIIAKEKEIKFEKDKDKIKVAVETYIKKLSNIRFDMRDNLSKTLDVKQEEIEEHIRSHFNKSENAEVFLSEGLDFLPQKTKEGGVRSCVFCSQELGEDAEKLLETYSSFFKGGYADLQKVVEEENEYFKELNIEAGLGAIASDLKSKDLDVGLSEEKVKLLVKYKKDFETELESKRDLNYEINFEAFDSLKKEIDEIKDKLENIQETKLNVKSLKTISALEVEKSALELIKKRHDPVWIEFCSDMKIIEVESERVRKERESKRVELQTYSAGIFSRHKKSINYFCNEMGADFEIGDFKPMKKIVGTSERIFSVKFFGSHRISIDNDKENTPNFKNTLSESDKRLLAFAFFLSLLKHDSDLDKKIIIFDDPMSSMDNERRRDTIHLLIDIAYLSDEKSSILYPAQKIILTHEEGFAKELKRCMSDACTLKIEGYVDDNGDKRSTIKHANFETEFPDNDITQRIDRIKNILDSESFSEPFHQDCRIVLEHVFKCKYLLYLKTEIAAKNSIRTFTTSLNNQKVGGFEDVAKNGKFLRLCDALNIELHDNNSTSSNGDKKSVLKDFFICLGSI